MKTLYTLILLLFVSLPTFASTALCPSELENLPIQTKGRVKPLGVHAKEVIKYMTGKTKFQGKSAMTVFCEVSVQKLTGQDYAKSELIKVDHIKTREFLEIGAEVKMVTPEFALSKLTESEKYARMLESRNDKSAHATDIKAFVLRTKVYRDLSLGLNWKLPILMSADHTSSEGHTQSPDKSKIIRWISLSDLQTLFPEQIKSAADAVRSAIVAGTKYTNEIDDNHLLEATYDRLHLFHWAILATLISVFCASVFKNPSHMATLGSVLLIFAAEITAVTYRTIISGRAPVTNMYETVMWVGLGSLFFATILTFIRKERLFMIIGLIMNLACLFMMTFANNMLNPSIEPLVPVLRDNFWLSTHVTLITISYAAFALSWLISNFYMVKASFKNVTMKESKRLNLLAYDCIKIGVVLLALGIILGGIWADYSWGRFWGWDPKETWALIALLTYIAILHGRFSGWINIEKFLPAVGMAFLTIIMAWFGVNFILAAGLHSYGFSNGGAVFITAIVAIQFLIFFLYILKRKTKAAKS